MKKAIAVLAVLLVTAAIARFYVFRLHEKEIAPAFYERKMKLEDFWLPEKSTPPGFSLARALPLGGENPSIFEAEVLVRLSRPRPQFPSQEKVTDVQLAAYTGTFGDQVLLIACEYAAGDAPETAPPGFLKDGVFLVTAQAPTPVLRETFMNTLSGRLDKLKQDSVKLNKVKTIGNVLLKLFMNLLVGAFGFVLALFLTKYFLITKQIEE